MKKILLGTASAVALSLLATSVMAGDWYYRNDSDNNAVALGVQLNSVEMKGSTDRQGSQAEDRTSEYKSGGGKKGYHGSSFWFHSSSSSENIHQGTFDNDNEINGSFNRAAGLFNVNQNNGNNVSQDAQNTVAAILNCDCDKVDDNTAVAIGVQASYVSMNYSTVIDDVGSNANLITGSFNNSAGLFNVNQNNGSNVSQKAQNTVAAIIGKSDSNGQKP